MGCGKQIKILNNHWLQHTLNPYITSELQGLSQATLSSLMIENGIQWDMDIVQDMFNYMDQQCIINTHIHGNEAEDSLFWNEDISGDYTVKSAYSLLQKQKVTRHSIVDNNM